MKAVSVVGYSKSGKTTTIETIVAELKKRNYRVGTIKDIHFEGFKMDTEGTNTDRHKKAGAELVIARGLHETDVLFQERLDLYSMARFYDVDFLVIEGIREANTPIILTADKTEDLDERWSDHVFMVSGKIADQIDEYKGLPAISVMQDPQALVDLVEETAFELLPDFPEKCCSACGMSCRQLCAAIIKGERKREDCVLDQARVHLSVNGKEIKMVPFVQNILENAVMGVVKELEGYQSDAKISIEIGPSWQQK
jgi:molybdopterin-guanine dinucleotide biosynthesis protein B